MTWTTRTPTQPGWYWLDTVVWGSRFKKVVEVCSYAGKLFIVGMGDISEYGGKWSSEPIKEPEEV